MKVKSESEVAQSCPTLHNPMDCSLPGSSIWGGGNRHFPLWSQTVCDGHTTNQVIPGPASPIPNHLSAEATSRKSSWVATKSVHSMTQATGSAAKEIPLQKECQPALEEPTSLGLCTQPESWADRWIWVSFLQQEKRWQSFLSQLSLQSGTKTRIILSKAGFSEPGSQGVMAGKVAVGSTLFEIQVPKDPQTYWDSHPSESRNLIINQTSTCGHAHPRWDSCARSIFNYQEKAKRQLENDLTFHRPGEKYIVWSPSRRKFQNIHFPGAGSIFSPYESHDRAFVAGSSVVHMQAPDHSQQESSISLLLSS